MYVSYLSGVFDFTGTQMVLTMKLTVRQYHRLLLVITIC